MLNIRPATPADVPQILAFIRDLATYEREPDAVHATEADLLRDGFGPTPRFHCLIAELNEAGTTSPQASPSTSTTTPPGAATPASTSKTSTSARASRARESAKPSSPASPPSP